DIPAITELGTPDALTLSTGVANVQVMASPEVAVVTLALVEHGASSLPAPGTTVPARITQHGGAAAPVLDVRQPDGYGPVPWQDEHHDVLVLVPQGHRLALDLTSDVGDIRTEGEFSTLTLASSIGDVQLDAVADSVTVRADVGAVRLQLADPAPTAVDVVAPVGSVDVSLPPDAEADVRIDAELGEV